MNKKILFGDVAVVAVILCLCVLVPWIAFDKQESCDVIVSVDGKTVETVPLSEEVTFSPDGGHTFVTVSGGRAYISASDCPDGLCMKMKKIDKDGGSVICLPNRVSVAGDKNENAGGADVAAG